MKIKVGDATVKQIKNYVVNYVCTSEGFELCTKCEIFLICCQPIGEWNMKQEIEVHDE